MNTKELMYNSLVIGVLLFLGIFTVAINYEPTSRKQTLSEKVINKNVSIHSYRCNDVILVNSKGQSYMGKGLSELFVLVGDKIVKVNLSQMTTNEKKLFCKQSMNNKMIDSSYIVSDSTIKALYYKGLI